MRISQQAAIYARKVKSESLNGCEVLLGPAVRDRNDGRLVMLITSKAKNGRLRPGAIELNDPDEVERIRKRFSRELGARLRCFDSMSDMAAAAAQLWPCPETAAWLADAQSAAAEGIGDTVSLNLEVRNVGL